jgi:hypothetical protein
LAGTSLKKAGVPAHLLHQTRALAVCLVVSAHIGSGTLEAAKASADLKACPAIICKKMDLI